VARSPKGGCSSWDHPFGPRKKHQGLQPLQFKASCDAYHANACRPSQHPAPVQNIVAAIVCKSCNSENLGKFRAEIAFHVIGLKNFDKPHVRVSHDELALCLDCGAVQFVVPEAALRKLSKKTPSRRNTSRLTAAKMSLDRQSLLTPESANTCGVASLQTFCD